MWRHRCTASDPSGTVRAAWDGGRGIPPKLLHRGRGGRGGNRASQVLRGGNEAIQAQSGHTAGCAAVCRPPGSSLDPIVLRASWMSISPRSHGSPGRRRRRSCGAAGLRAHRPTTVVVVCLYPAAFVPARVHHHHQGSRFRWSTSAAKMQALRASSSRACAPRQQPAAAFRPFGTACVRPSLGECRGPGDGRIAVLEVMPCRPR